MPIAILKFKLPEEREEYETVIKASVYYCALVDIKNFLRNKRKYTDEESITIEAMEAAFYEMVDDCGDL